MTELEQVLAMEEKVVFEGKTYTLGAITPEVVAAWEQWLGRNTFATLLSSLGGSGLLAEDKAMKAVAELAAEGMFEFLGEASQKRLTKLSGQKKLAFLRVQQHHPDTDEATISRMVETEWERIYRALKREQLARPNDLAPEAETEATGAATNESPGQPSSPESAISTP